MAKGKKTGGRVAGTANKTTRSAREAFALAFETIQRPGTSLAEWAALNPTEFYKLYARLIPVEHVGDGGTGPVQAIVKHVYEDISESGKTVKL